jgi:hypothetical protein
MTGRNRAIDTSVASSGRRTHDRAKQSRRVRARFVEACSMRDQRSIAPSSSIVHAPRTVARAFVHELNME